jgi:hypothetical protein
MIITNKLAISLGLSTLIAMPLTATFSFPSFAASAVAMFDTDKDGTIDLAEAKAAASAAFDKLEKDKDGSLDAKEAKGHLSKANFAASDTDKDGTVT